MRVKALGRELHRDDRGVSLVELIVTITISTIVLAVIITAIVQFYALTRWGNAQLLLENDFQTANLWLGRDAAEAASFTSGSGLTYGTFHWADGSGRRSPASTCRGARPSPSSRPPGMWRRKEM